MLEESELNILVYNIVSEIRHSHCRLCLKLIENKYVRFQDLLSMDVHNKEYVCLSTMLTNYLGPESCEGIGGIDAICIECVEQTLETARFLKTCENSTKLLHKVFDNLLGKLGDNIDTAKDHSMYITMSEDDAKVEFVNKEILRKIMASPTQKIYPCAECTKNFHTLDDFIEHNMKIHNMLTCDKCFETCTDEQELSAHNASSISYKCEVCKIHKCTEESLKVHCDKVHEVHVCQECGKSYRGREKLLRHEERHSSKSECPKCGKTYTTREFFLRHVKLCLKDMLDPHPIRSEIEKKYFCDRCQKGYSTPGGLRVHNRFVHGNAKPHTCQYCNKQFTAPSYLKAHMVKHTGEKNFKCDRCSKKFVSKEALLYHTRRHTGEKPYSCTTCDEKFVNASARAEHIKFKHVGPTMMCEICSRKFVTRNFLQMHIKKHHDPTNKLYTGRTMVPPNIPARENMRVRLSENEIVS